MGRGTCRYPRVAPAGLHAEQNHDPGSSASVKWPVSRFGHAPSPTGPGHIAIGSTLLWTKALNVGT